MWQPTVEVTEAFLEWPHTYEPLYSGEPPAPAHEGQELCKNAGEQLTALPGASPKEVTMY